MARRDGNALRRGDRERDRGAPRRAPRRGRRARRRGARLDADLHRAGQRRPVRRRVARLHRRGPGDEPRWIRPASRSSSSGAAAGPRRRARRPRDGPAREGAPARPHPRPSGRHGSRSSPWRARVRPRRHRGRDGVPRRDATRAAASGSSRDIACFSFNGNKIITTGGGGMLVTDDEACAKKARYLTTQAKDDPVEFVHDEIGYNYRLTNVLAAIGVAQLERLAGIRRDGRDGSPPATPRRCRDVPGLTFLGEAPWARATFWMSVVRVSTRRRLAPTRAPFFGPSRGGASRRGRSGSRSTSRPLTPALRAAGETWPSGSTGNA